VRSRRQLPVARQNSSSSDIPPTFPTLKEPVHTWVELPPPFKLHPRAVLQSTPWDQVAHIERQWATQHTEFLVDRCANGEQYRLESVVVEPLSEYQHKELKRKRALAEFKALPLKSQIPKKLPAGMNDELYLQTLLMRQQCGFADENAYQTMNSFPPCSQDNEYQQYPSWQKVKQLLDGPSMPQFDELASIERNHYEYLGDLATASTFGGNYRTIPHLPSEPIETYLPTFEDNHYLQSTLGAHDSIATISESAFGRPPGVAEQLLAIQPSNQGPVDTSSTILPQQLFYQGVSFSPPMQQDQMMQPTPRVAQMMLQNPVQSPSTIRPQFQGNSGPSSPIVVQSPTMIQRQPQANGRLSTRIIDGSRLLEHELMRQRERKTQEMQAKEQHNMPMSQQPIMNTTMAQMAQQESRSTPWISEAARLMIKHEFSWDKFRQYCQIKQFDSSQTAELLHHTELAEWNPKQKREEYMRMLPEHAKSMVQQNLSLGRLLMFRQNNGLSQFWLKDVMEHAKVLGWDPVQKKEEYQRGLQQVAQLVVSKNVSEDNLKEHCQQIGYSQFQFNDLLRVLELLGWNSMQKTESQQTAQQQQLGAPQQPENPQVQVSMASSQHTMMFQPQKQQQRSLSAHQGSPQVQALMSPFDQAMMTPTWTSPQQQQRRRSMSLQQRAAMLQEQRAISPKMQMSPRMQMLMSPSQQQMANLQGMHPQQQAAMKKQYHMSMRQQAQTQQWGLQQPFEPTPAPALTTPSPNMPGMTVESMQANMANTENRGQGAPVNFGQMSSSPSKKSNSPKKSSPYQSRRSSPKKTTPPKRKSPIKEIIPGTGFIDLSPSPSSSMMSGSGNLDVFGQPQYQTIHGTNGLKLAEKMTKRSLSTNFDAAALEAERQSAALAAATKHSEELYKANSANRPRGRGARGMSNLEIQTLIRKRGLSAESFDYSQLHQDPQTQGGVQQQQFAGTQLFQDNTQGMSYMQAHASYQAPMAPMYPPLHMGSKRPADNEYQTPSKKVKAQE
jgi:hypothetical protein